MNRNNIQFIETEAFKKNVNIELCNELINFVAETSSNDSNDTLKKIEEKCIWFKKKDILEIKNICEIEYFGELLERYEDKIGNDIRDIRAISLALGYAKDLITSNMIIGTQLVDFINKIKNMASDDIYLQGALYLYDNKKYIKYEEELLNKKYTNTEDIVFVLALFDDIKKSFNILRQQIISLLGKNKTISAINNIKLYSWIINTLYSFIKKDRKKDIEILKTLILVPTKQIKEEDNIYKILLANHYEKEEIAYLNYGLLYYTKIPKTVRLCNSITEERIAINFCKTIMNSSHTQHEAIYRLIDNMLREYRNFKIKCRGKEGLKEAIKDEINIINPMTLLEFYKTFDKNTFAFDILDKKWDILAQKMENSDYKEFFDNFIDYNNFNREKLEKCIEKYNKLTNTSYLESFFSFEYNRKSVFEQLVNKDIISLKKYYEVYEQQKETENKDIEHLKRYVSGIHHKNAFLFLQYILEDRKYVIEDIDKFEFDLKYLYENRKYSYDRERRMDVQKEFLSKEEQQKLFFWLDNYMFKMHPNDYIEFITDLLKEDNIKEIVSTDQLREIYFILIKIDEKIAKNDELRKKYLTEIELQNIIDKEKQEKEREKIEEYKKKQEEITNKFNELPKQSFKELNDFCFEYKWNDDEWKICNEIVKQYLYKNIETFEVNEDEIIRFMQLFELLLRKKVISIKEFKKYIFTYIQKEEIDNGIIKGTC